MKDGEWENGRKEEMQVDPIRTRRERFSACSANTRKVDRSCAFPYQMDQISRGRRTDFLRVYLCDL